MIEEIQSELDADLRYPILGYPTVALSAGVVVWFTAELLGSVIEAPAIVVVAVSALAAGITPPIAWCSLRRAGL